MDQVRNPTADSSDAAEPASTASTPSPPSVEPSSGVDEEESRSAFSLIYTGSEAANCEVEMIDRTPPSDSPHDGGHAIIDHPHRSDNMKVPRDQLEVNTDLAA